MASRSQKCGEGVTEGGSDAVKIQVRFGALSEPIYKQVKLPRRRCRGVQEMADAVTLLKIAGIITDAQAHTARQKLMKRILSLF